MRLFGGMASGALPSLGIPLRRPAYRRPVRLTTIRSLAFLIACSDPADPGDPLPLTPRSLEGRWVKIQVVLSTSAAPVLSDTTEIPENGEVDHPSAGAPEPRNISARYYPRRSAGGCHASRDL